MAARCLSYGTKRKCSGPSLVMPEIECTADTDLRGESRLRGQPLTDTVEKGFTEVGLPAPVRKGFLCHCLGCNYDSPTTRDRNWILSDHISSVLRSTFSTASTRTGHVVPSVERAARKLIYQPTVAGFVEGRKPYQPAIGRGPRRQIPSNSRALRRCTHQRRRERRASPRRL